MVLLSLVLGLTPLITFAAVCAEKGETVVYVNGILTNLVDAKNDLFKLKTEYLEKNNESDVHFINGYNPSHLAGLGDLVQSVFQAFGSSISDYDLHTILRQIQPQITTRKLLLVGHSQGTFYTNALYDYLIAHGEPKDAVGVYNVATPASYVAGGGKYLTSQNDLLIKLFTQAAQKAGRPLPLIANISIPIALDDIKNTFPGHQFAVAYLAGASDRIVSDISKQLSVLVPTFSSDVSYCFDAPDKSLGYKIQGLVFAVADPAAQGVRIGSIATYNGVVAVFTTSTSIAKAGLGAVVGIFHNMLPNFVAAPAEIKTTEINFAVVKSLYGSSLDLHDLDELLKSTQGAAVVASQTKPGVVLGEETGPNTPEIVSATTTERYVLLDATTTPPYYRGGMLSGGSSGGPLPEVHEDPIVEVIHAPATTTATTTDIEIEPVATFDASTTAPTITVSDCAYSLSDDVCLIATTTLTFSWTQTDKAVLYGVLLNGTEVQITAATSTTLVGLEDRATTTLEIVAYDSAHTATTSTSVDIRIFTRPILINEVGWAGTNASHDDQWVEFKNNTPFWLNLSHLALVSGIQETHYISLEPMAQYFAPTIRALRGGKFSPNSFNFWIVERTEGALQSRSAYPLPFELLNPEGDQVRLLWETNSSSTIVDQTPSVAVCGGWCAGSLASTTSIFVDLTGDGVQTILPHVDAVSMERVEAADGTLAESWASSSGYPPGVTDRNDERIFATPTRKNVPHYPQVGWSCHSSDTFVPEDERVASRFNSCLFLTNFVTEGVDRVAAIYKGVVGSSTYTGVMHNLHGYVFLFNSIQTTLEEGQDYEPGDLGFVAIWQTRGSADDRAFDAYFTQGQGSGVEPLHSNYRVFPFIFGS